MPAVRVSRLVLSFLVAVGLGAACALPAYEVTGGSGGASQGTAGTGAAGGGTSSGGMACTDPSMCPAPSSSCAVASCSQGVCGTSPRAVDDPCSEGGGQVCDGNGHCVACNPSSVGKCLGTDDDCQARTCVGNVCGIAYQPMGTPAAMQLQMPDTCTKVVCDGTGNHTTVPDPTNDDDGNACTADSCNGANQPVHTPVPDGTKCGTGGVLACVMGQCSGCTSDGQCQPPAYDTCGGGGKAGACGCTPTTCGAQKVTCGSWPDGCGGMLSCNDGMKDGLETDVDCGGGTAGASKCASLCAQGKKCAVNGDCTTGHCVDSVCCDTACSGTCVACTAAKKGAGIDGACGPIKLGSDPDGECPAQAASTCGRSGGCNGAGACSLYANGAVCSAATCAGVTLTGAATCTGTGTCQAGTQSSCAPYACNGTACYTSCTTKAQCAPATCGGGSQTTEGTCSAGGTCKPGTTKSCGYYTCNGTACYTSCTTIAQCASPNVCFIYMSPPGSCIP